MIWQDVVITITSVVFVLSLIPQVYDGFKEKVGPIKLQTSIPIFLCVYINGFVFSTLGLYFSAVVTVVNGTLWFVLFLHRVMYGKPIRSNDAKGV